MGLTPNSVVTSDGVTFVSKYGDDVLNGADRDTRTFAGGIYIYPNDYMEWVPIYTSPSIYGFNLGGHYGTTQYSTVDRFTFPFDSGYATNIGSLSGTRSTSAACNSSNYGFSSGGITYGYLHLSTIDRITFPFDEGTADFITNLSGSREGPTGCNSSNYGFIMGGESNISSIDRITFPFDVGTSVETTGVLSNNNKQFGACNSSKYGYTFGGYGYTSYIDRITFPFDVGSTASIVANLSTTYLYYSAGCNSSTYGYNIGGYSIISLTLIDSIDFAFDSNTAIATGLLSSDGKYGLTACNSSNYGYAMSGRAGVVYVSTIERISFPFGPGGIAVDVGNLSGIKTNSTGMDTTDFVGFMR